MFPNVSDRLSRCNRQSRRRGPGRLVNRDPALKLRSPWLIRWTAHAAAVLLRVWLGTVRVRVVSADGHAHPADPEVERFIYAFWHEALLAPAKMKANVKVLVSRSADGELIAQVCRRLGIGVVRGSPAHGGVKGLLDLLRDGQNAHLAFTPDGPRGPRRQLKSGIVFAASHTGLPIVPVGVGFSLAWRARSWDRFAVPRPFSTVTGVIGQPIVVPPRLDHEGIDRYRRLVEDTMLEVTRAAERWAAGSREWGVRSGELLTLRSPVSRFSPRPNPLDHGHSPTK
jgi:lysophospholipid acyltransferase (LPLAT)-like uncharacterized protein